MSDLSVGTLGGASNPGYSSAALANLDKDTFLQLLVAQMKYQNPLEPVNSQEYLSQAAQYASVEQLENMAESQAQLRSMQMVTIATGLVGQEVTAFHDLTGEELTGIVDTVRFGAEPILIVDGAEIPLSSVLSVTAAPATTADPAITPAVDPTSEASADDEDGGDEAGDPALATAPAVTDTTHTVSTPR